MEKPRFASLTVEALNILFASTPSCFHVAFTCATSRVARTGPAPSLREGVEAWLAAVTFLSHDARLAAALAITITLCAEGAHRVAAAGQAALLAPEAVEAVPAPLTVGTISVVPAARAVPAVAGGAVQLRVKVALLCPPIAITRQAFVGTFCCCSPPRPVIEEGKALLTVIPKGVVLAVADQLPKLIPYALTRVAIAFASATNGKIRNRVVIRLKDFGVIENFISKGVEAVEAHPNIGGCHPFLQHRAVVKVVGTGTSLQR